VAPDVGIAWSTVEVVSGPSDSLELRVALEPTPDPAWHRAFDQRTAHGPTDGQWSAPTIEGETSIVVRAIPKSVDVDALRAWLDDLVNDITALAAEILKEEEAASARWAEAAGDTERRAREVQERLRGS
jgi:hypothetical protein